MNVSQLAVGSFVRYVQQVSGASYGQAVTAASVAWAASRIDPNGATSGQLGPFGVPEYLARDRGLSLANAEDYPHYIDIAAFMSDGWRNWGPFPTAWAPGSYDPGGTLRAPQRSSQATAALPTVKAVLAGRVDPRTQSQGEQSVQASWGTFQRFVGPYARNTHGSLANYANQLGRIIR